MTMTMEMKQARRIQTSVLNGLEKRALVWMAERMPRWVSSDLMSFTGFIGSLMIAAGYALTSVSPSFLWLSSAGFLVNWFGDSLDGTLARVRNMQRPVYGYFLDHTLDCVNELIMFTGLGLSPLMDMRVALLILVAYLLMTINVEMNAHLKGEFKLTFAKLGPTEFRVIAVILNTVLVLSPSIRELEVSVSLLGRELCLTVLDIAGLSVAAILLVIYLFTVFNDLAGYSTADPRKR